MRGGEGETEGGGEAEDEGRRERQKRKGEGEGEGRGPEWRGRNRESKIAKPKIGKSYTRFSSDLWLKGESEHRYSFLKLGLTLNK